jgi:aminoglycoside phosphotransferase (APT) family kinase protein
MRAELSAQLLTVLREVTGKRDLAYRQAPEELRGGFWAELVWFSLADAPAGWDGELVARLMPEPAVARKETIVQSAVAAAGVRTPTVRASGGPDAGLGRAYMIMDRAPGAPMLHGLGGLRMLTAAPRLARQIPDVLASSMAELHAVDPAAVRNELATVTGVARTVPELVDDLRVGSKQRGRIDLASVADWLLAHPPATRADVICHGDLHPFNLLIDSAGRVTVLDWSTSLIGPAVYDVAFTSLMVGEPPVQGPAAVQRSVRAAGRWLASKFVREYAKRTGTAIDPAELEWYQAVVCLRALLEVAGWVDEGTIDAHRGHPWLMGAPGYARRLTTLTAVSARPT